ncbi:protein-disulfide reductase DsbD domain-containing protein [Lichenibacterium minor]|nr:protein-disulfide reductase DsbD domain-containing protein [Lichenibacterium minor]
MLRLLPIPLRPALLGAGAALLATALPQAVDAAPVTSKAAEAAGRSPWSEGAQSRARLIDAGPGPGGHGLLAGVEIRLEPRFITYWRDPGDAGVPPSFSFAGSTNLKTATVRYPAPSKFDEAGAEAFGYRDDVVFPVLVEPADPSKPVGLAVTLDYAACHDICLPAHADLRLALGRGAAPEAAWVGDALSAVPRPGTVGGGGTPAVRGVEPAPDGGFRVTASGAGRGAALFVEAPEGWAYAAGTPVVAGGDAVFPVKRLDRPKGAEVPPAPLVLTLTAPAGSVEVPVTLDGAAPKP